MIGRERDSVGDLGWMLLLVMWMKGAVEKQGGFKRWLGDLFEMML